MRFLRAWIAAVLLSVLGYLLFVWLGVAYPPLRLFGAMTQLLGVPKLFQLVHAVFGLGQGGKIFAFSGVVVLWLGGLTLLGGLWRGQIAGLMVFVLGLIFTPWYIALGYGLAFWFILDAANLWLAPRVRAVTVRPIPPDPGRRSTTLALAAGGAVVAGGGLTALFRDPGAAPAAASTTASIVPGQPLPFGVTPVDQWYYVSKNLEPFDPNVNGKTWSLKVGGLVRTPLTLSLADLKGFAPVTEELTLSCISNPLGGPLISNGIWQGFRLSELLKKAGVQGGAKYLLWEAADGYTESLPLGRALEDDILLVHSLNGQPLTPKHGYPLRVLIPGRYGMKQPRWITKITLSATDVPGYWVKRGWSKTALVELTSRIDQPAEISPIVKADAPGFIRGIAFYGDQPITKVEVTTDGGKTWQPAKLVAPRSKSVWTPWEFSWTPAAGSYDVQVRAYSGDRVQKKAESDALPEGATGYHHFIVNVS